MSTTYTPGPWHRGSRDNSNYLDMVVAKSPRGKDIVIARCPRPRIGCPTANARLIAAAPDLLAILQTIVTNASTDIYGVPTDDIEAAREAIRKATTP